MLLALIKRVSSTEENRGGVGSQGEGGAGAYNQYLPSVQITNTNPLNDHLEEN